MKESVMRKIILSILLTSLMTGQSGAAEDAMSRESLDSLLVSIVTAEPENHASVLGAALEENPSETGLLVSTGLASGFSHQSIQGQCDTGLSGGQIKDLMVLLIENDAEVEPVMASCLPHVPVEDLTDVMIAILQRVEPIRLEPTIQLALNIFSENGYDARSVLVSSLVDSGALGVDGVDCGVDCLTPLAENLIDGMALEKPVVDDEAQEPALSNS